MEKDSEKKSSLRPSSEESEHGNSQGFDPKEDEKEPARILELSQSFFAADTCEEDESMMIPPTQELLIPNTPPRAETSDKEGNVSTGNNDTSSNLDETQIEDIPKGSEPEEKKDEEDFMEFGSQNDMTQDISGLVETQQILPSRSSDPSKEDDKEHDDDDDDWQLKFSLTQETQELLSTAKTREMREQEDARLTTISEEKSDTSPQKDMSEEDTAKLESKDPMYISGDKKEDDDDSENEIEPSQSCLNDEYSAFRDQLTQIAQEAQTAHSTPDCTFNGGQTTSKFDSKAVPVSPIGTKPENNQTVASEPVVSEHEQTTDILSSDSKFLSCESPVKGESKEDSAPILVLDTEPEQLPKISFDAPEKTIDDDKSVKETTVVCDTIELMSSVDDTVGEDPKQIVSSALEKTTAKTAEKVIEHEKESENSNENELLEAVELIAKDDKEDLKVSDVPSTEEQGVSGISSGENGIEEKKPAEISDCLPDTLPTAMLPPLTTSRLSRKQKFEITKKNLPGAPYEKSEKSAKSYIGTYKDTKSLEKIFNSSYGIFLDHECMESMLSLKPSEELNVRKVLDFTVKNNRVYLQQSIEIGSPSYLQHLHSISPHSGSSSNTTSSTVSTIKSLHSGEMADISSSSSAKSANSSSVIQFDTTAHSSISSQEHGRITSTQNSEQQHSSFGNMFNQKKKDSFEMEREISPIRKMEEPTKTASGRKRGGKKTAPANNKAPPAPKRKRGRAVKGGDEAGPSTASSSSSSANKDPEQCIEGRTKKSLRRKKNEKEEPPPKAVAESSVEEIVVSDGNDPYKDSPYGSILPGVRVMARWKDGYYYPGIVQSQELEGRWSVRFDDNDIRAIPQENLIKVYNLEIGTSVLVMSPDGFYDPGIVCGHYKDSAGSGYEVEMDSGVTKRYPRSAVILSNDQAKLLTSSRPPRTPATITINLDNLIEGKRKRKTIQSPEPPNPALKKTRRTSQRISKIDPNLDSTEESTSTEKESTSFKRPAESTETEEEVIAEQRSTRKRKAAKMGAVKITQSLAQSSGKHPKLFKDYAFLLTNAERKPPPIAYDSESFDGSEDEIMTFNKDELVDYIFSRGGTILDKFEDIQKCPRKNIFLLANTYLRTMKYIKCLAAGIHCIKHHWVHNCCYKETILDHFTYILPAGKSLISNRVIEWHGKSDVLKGLKICLISAPENPFVNTWAPVLLAAKADFVQKWNLPSSKSGGNIHVDVLITNIQCPVEILLSAKRRKIPIVSSEWVIQSLIGGKCLPYDAHPKFKHDFTE